MASGVGDLVATLGVNSANWSAGLAKASGGLKSFAASASATLGSFAAYTAGVFGAGLSLRAADEDIRATQRLESVLRATGGAAGLTAQEIGAYASELQKSTNFGDEVTNQAAAILATFKNISGGAFKQTLSLAQDLAELKQIPLKSAVEQLGKALNDPIKGLTLLRKVGIQFTESEKEQIKAMTDAGNAAGAQAVMLKALEETFGGTAEASASSLVQIQNYVGDLAEEIGKVLMPFVKAIGDSIKTWLPQWGPWIAKAVVATTAMSIALKGVAIAQAVVNAISGPVGWAKLAIGIGIAAAAVTALEAGLRSTSDQASATAASVRKLADTDAGDVSDGDAKLSTKVQQWADRVKKAADTIKDVNSASGVRKEIDDIASAFAVLHKNAVNAGAPLYQLRQFEFQKRDAIWQTIDKFSGFSDKLKDVNDQIRLMKGITTESAIELEKMAEAMVPPDKLAELKSAMDQLDNMKRLEDERQRVNERLAKDAETRKRMMEDGKSSGSTSVGALQKGGVDAVSAVLKAVNSPQEKAAEEQLGELQQHTQQFSIMTDHMRAIAEGRGGAIIVAGGLN